MKPVFRLAMASALLALCSAASAQINTWTGSGGDYLWSDVNNWNPASLPGLADEVVFTNAGASSGIYNGANADNIVNSGNPTAAGLWYSTDNAWHNTVITNGQTLTLTNTGVAKMLGSGTEGDLSSGVSYASISGTNGTLVVNDTNVGSAIYVSQGSQSAYVLATLDLSQLG